MRSIYADVDHLATVNIWPNTDGNGNRAMLTGIEVNEKYRGHGYASALLKRVLEDADREGVTLVLGVSPDDSLGCLTYDQLHAWYGRHDFVVNSRIEDNDGSIMIRYPKGQKGAIGKQET